MNLEHFYDDGGLDIFKKLYPIYCAGGDGETTMLMTVVASMSSTSMSQRGQHLHAVARGGGHHRRAGLHGGGRGANCHCLLHHAGCAGVDWALQSSSQTSLVLLVG